MGYNTVAVILNDALHAIEADTAVGAAISNGVRSWYGRVRDPNWLEVPAGGHCPAIRIISQGHADGEQVTIVHGNTGWTASEAQPGTPRELTRRGLDQMQRCLERHGYRVTRLPSKPVGAPAKMRLTADDLAVLRAMNERDDDFGYMNFRTIAADSGVDRKAIRRIVRRLARGGLTTFSAALSTEDGLFAGAGYKITDAGRALMPEESPLPHASGRA